MRNVSNSEVQTYLSCKRMYNFAFINNITPKETSDPLSRGTLGHLAFEYYVQARLNDSNHESAMKAGLYAFEEATKNRSIKLDIILQTQMLFIEYMEYHKGWPEFRLLGTEQRKDLQLTDTLNMTIRYDLYVEDLRTGEKAIGDYKFTYDFWSPDEHDLNAQMPKYITVMNLNNERVDYGFLEEIRTRTLSKDKARDPKNKWRRTTYRPTAPMKSNMIRQHVAASLEIEKHRALSDEERDAVSIPVMNKHGACKYCNFKDLCHSMNQGAKDLSVAIESNYTQNHYGYNNQNVLGDIV